MKSINKYINEGQEQSSLVKKIVKLLDGDISEAIAKRMNNWDENKFDWSRDPMFLIADEDNNIEGEEHVRNLEWVRKKTIKHYNITGTISNYDIKNDEGAKPCSILGIFIDRSFFPIASIETYQKILDLIDEKS